MDNTLKELTPEERKKRREDSVKPLVEAYFAWVKEKKKDGRIAEKSKTGKGLSYSLNQEEYLKVFLENGNVPLDNNAAERAIRNFCIGRKNWMIIDTIRGAQSSAMIYSIAETAKANHLKPYEYFEYDFTCTNAKDMYYEVLADRVHYFKEDEKGVAIMCKAMEDMRNEAAREAEKMKAIRMARLMIEDGKLSYEDIAMYTELTLEEVEKIALEKKSA